MLRAPILPGIVEVLLCVEPDITARRFCRGPACSRFEHFLKQVYQLGFLAAIRPANWPVVTSFLSPTTLPLRSGRLVCIMRENNHNNYPCYLAFSDDQGLSWSSPKPAPFSGDRTFAGQLDDGLVLVTYRNKAGTPGLYACIGDMV